MVDVNRIREQAADWLGDVGDAALRAVTRRVRGGVITDPGEQIRAWRAWGHDVGAVPGDVSTEWDPVALAELVSRDDIDVLRAAGWTELHGVWAHDYSPDRLDVRRPDDLAALRRAAETLRALATRLAHELKAEQGRSATAAPSYACGDAGCRMVGQEQNRAGACPAGLRELDALPDEDAATDPSADPASVGAWPWRGIEHDAHISRWAGSDGDWNVVAHGPDGEERFVAIFNGPHAEARAREYAALMSAPLPCTPVLLVGQDRAADNGVWCDRHGGRFVDAPSPPVDTPEPPRLLGTPTHPKPCGAFRALSAGGIHCGDCGWYAGAHASGKPAAVALCHRWSCVGVDGELEVCELRPALAGFSGEVGLRPPGSVGPATVRARETDMLGLKEWRFLG